MALRMVASNRAADGRWFARKGIPQDVRKEYARLYGVSREAHLKLPADASRHEAKTRLGEWEAEIETRIATLRALQKGEGQPLTKLNAIVLAGRSYTWFVGQHENDDASKQISRGQISLGLPRPNTSTAITTCLHCATYPELRI